MNKVETCFGCEAPMRRGYPMVTQSGKDVIICERCKRIWEKANTEKEAKAKGTDDE